MRFCAAVVTNDYSGRQGVSLVKDLIRAELGLAARKPIAPPTAQRLLGWCARTAMSNYWPRDLPGYVFVLRAIEQIKGFGVPSEPAREALRSRLIERPDERAIVQSPNGGIVGHLKPEVWSSPASSTRIFETGSWLSRRASGGPRTFEALRHGVKFWVQIPKSSVSIILKVNAGRQTHAVTRHDREGFKQWWDDQVLTPTSMDAYRWGKEHGFSRDQVRNCLLTEVKTRKSRENARSIARHGASR